jgi:hypothetical protein
VIKRQILIHSTLFLALGTGSVATSAQKANPYKTYSNARFNYSISYPANVLTPQGESANGDGQVFRASDGSAEMRVYGRNNVSHETLQGLYLQLSHQWGNRVTYKVKRQDWFVVTASVNRKIHYQKTILRHGVLKTFEIEYDSSRRATFDPITTRISKSFTG